jgi:nucleoside-diphosphate-sugar epimerase
MAQHDELHVVFGTGALGRAVVKELYTAGKTVRAVNRRGKAEFPASVEVMAADVLNAQSAMRAGAGGTVVYQCVNPPYDKWPALFPRMQENIVNAAAANGAKLAVAENLYMYGEIDGVIHEGLPHAATTRKGKTRAAMTEALVKAHESGTVQVTIARASDFYGPNVFGSVVGDRVFPNAIKGKKVSAIGDLTQPHTYTYIADFARALVTLATHQNAFGEVWHVPAAETLTTGAFIKLIFEIAGKEPKIGTMNAAMLRIGGVIIPAAREMIEMMYEFEKPFVVDSSKYVRTFGDHATPVREAIRQTVEWFTQRGKGKLRVSSEEPE